MFTQDDAPWQKDLVAAYVAKGDSLAKWPTTKDKVDFTGRATPDVAALGEGYQVRPSPRISPHLPASPATMAAHGAP